MTPHIHAKEMMQYAQDAQETLTPYKLWETTYYGSDIWADINDHPRWRLDAVYRRKKPTLVVNGYEVLAGLKEISESTSPILYIATPWSKLWYVMTQATPGALEKGIAYNTPEQAAARAKAMLGIDPKAPE